MFTEGEGRHLCIGCNSFAGSTCKHRPVIWIRRTALSCWIRNLTSACCYRALYPTPFPLPRTLRLHTQHMQAAQVCYFSQIAMHRFNTRQQSCLRSGIDADIPSVQRDKTAYEVHNLPNSALVNLRVIFVALFLFRRYCPRIIMQIHRQLPRSLSAQFPSTIAVIKSCTTANTSQFQ